MMRRFVYHFTWFLLVVFVVYATIIYTIEAGLSDLVWFVVVGLFIVALAVVRQFADRSLGRGRKE